MKKFIGIILAVVLALAITVPAYAAVSTDQTDYAPGSVITISGDNSNGAGYQPGETVKVDVTYPDSSVISYESTPVAEDGSWSVQFTLPNDESAVGSYNYTATGLTSEVKESGTFTDAVNLKIIGVDGGQHTVIGSEEDLGSVGKGINLIESIGVTATGLGSSATQAWALSYDTSSGQGSTLSPLTSIVPSSGTILSNNAVTSIQMTISTGTLTAGTTYHGKLQAVGTGAGPNYYYFRFTVIPSAKVTVTASPGGAQGGTFSITLTLPGASATTTQSGTTPQDFYVEPETGFSISSIQSPVGAYTYTGADPVTGTAGAADSATTVTLTYSSGNTDPDVTAPADQTVNEGTSKSFLLGSFVDPDNGPWSVDVDWGDGSSHTTFNMSSAGTITAQSHTYADNLPSNAPYTVTVKVTDDLGAFGSATFKITVYNVAPDIISYTGDNGEWQVMPITGVSVGGAFTDPGTLDTHDVLIDWGTGAGFVTEVDDLAAATHTFGPLSHTYSQPGIYDIQIKVTDKDGASDIVSLTIVVYDPNGGFVTGGGWIISPAGAYIANPDLTGKATFGFVSKYVKGKSSPTGNTEFQFHAAGMNFSSTLYDWLVCAGTKAQYKGTGTINGTGNYGFMLFAIDGGNKGADLFRIKIWDKDNNDAVVYDNELGALETDDPTTVIGSGSIVVHK